MSKTIFRSIDFALNYPSQPTIEAWAILCALTLGGILCSPSRADCPLGWQEGFHIPTTFQYQSDSSATSFHCIKVFDDGTGPTVYVGGLFDGCTGVSCKDIMKYNGLIWSGLGAGVTSGTGNRHIYGIEVFDDDDGGTQPPALYACGNFTAIDGTAASRIAKWDGASWNALGSGLGNGAARSMVVFDSDGGGPGLPALFVGGAFTTAGGGSANYIAKWDGNSWTPLDSGMNGDVKCLAQIPIGALAGLYAGGSFTTAGGTTVNRIARWDGTTWSALAGGLPQNVTSLTVMDGQNGEELIAGCSFDAGCSCARVYRWDGLAWTAMPQTLSNEITSLFVFDSGNGAELYAGGAFNFVPALIRNIVRWDITTQNWIVVAGGVYFSGTGGSVAAMCSHDFGEGPVLFAAGDFNTADDFAAQDIACYNGTDWAPLGNGVSGGSILAFTASMVGGQRSIFAGGTFTMAGGLQTVPRIAKWDGWRWHKLSSGTITGTSPFVSAILEFDADADGPEAPKLICGGGFTGIGGLSVISIAAFDGTSWSTLGGSGTSASGTVQDLAIWDLDGPGGNPPELYVGGSFTTIGGVSANQIARWNGATWSALGTGTGSTINALAVYNDGNGEALYAGGGFTTAGGGSANRIAKWNGTSWSALGSGVNNTVQALTVFDDGGGAKLCVGGQFTTAGGNTANRIAQWNGSTWSAVTTGMNNTINALAVFDPDGAGSVPASLHAGGAFTTADGMTANRIARFTGSTWADLDGGVNNTVSCLYVDDEDGTGPNPPVLYVGGAFTTAGTVSSSEIAAWSIVPSPPSITQQPTSQTACEGGAVGLSVTATGDPPVSYQWRRGLMDLTNGVRISGAQTFEITISPALPTDTGADYKCVVTSACGTATTSSVEVTIFSSGSANGNGDVLPVNGLDVQGMVSALVPPGQPPSDFLCAFDMNVDGAVTMDDVPPFVELLIVP